MVSVHARQRVWIEAIDRLRGNLSWGGGGDLGGAIMSLLIALEKSGGGRNLRGRRENEVELSLS